MNGSTLAGSASAELSSLAPAAAGAPAVAISPAERLYFAAVGLLALWVGYWGYFVPARIDSAIPWLVPPLHARFLGAVYLSGFTLQLGGLFSRRYAETRVLVPLTILWTGLLFLISLFYLDQFDYGRRQVWFWFGAYVAYPLIGAWLIWRHRGEAADLPGAPLAAPLRAYFKAQGLALSALALALLAFPAGLAALWPWKISTLLAQIYSSPFLSFGIAFWMLGGRRTWPEVRVVVRGAFVLSVLVLLASILHRALFKAADPAAWIWFGGFGAATAILGAILGHFARRGGTGERL